MKFDPEVMMEILYSEVIRCRGEVTRLKLQVELSSMRQAKNPVERLLDPEEFIPTKNIRSEGEL